MVSYFSKSIKSYATLAAPLNALRKLRTKFSWSDKCEANFIELKNRLANPPVLGIANFNKSFELWCDASSVALGSCLLQENENHEMQAIAYYSRKFTESELSLSIFEKEMLSVVNSIEKFYKFLEFQPFHLKTDNSALAWVLSHHNKLGKLGRWAHKIVSLPFYITHVKSELNPVADA